MDHERFEKANHLVINGHKVPCKADVVLWDESKLEVEIGDGARRRVPKTIIDLFVVHWTGGENDIRTLFHVLDKRELGVEFAIDIEGVVWQFCDPALVDTFDAGYINRRSMGVEIVNYGFRRKVEDIPKQGLQRDTYVTGLHGKRREFARFFPAQLNALKYLLDAVCGYMPTIPKCIPLDEDGKILTSTMTRREVRNYSGVLGHFHVNSGKSDPGTDVFDMLMANGYADPARQSCQPWG